MDKTFRERNLYLLILSMWLDGITIEPHVVLKGESISKFSYINCFAHRLSSLMLDSDNIKNCFSDRVLKHIRNFSSDEELSIFSVSCSINDIDNISEQLLTFVDEITNRLNGSTKRPTILLCFEDFSKLLEVNDEVHDLLLWLAFYGPRANLWIVTTRKTVETDQMKRWIKLFRIQIAPIVSNDKPIPETVTLSVFTDPIKI